jgi:fructose-1,6-bisphosphatase/inositol monophosphatase family enzyme/ActR/RegA family two-component response regulator
MPRGTTADAGSGPDGGGASPAMSDLEERFIRVFHLAAIQAGSVATRLQDDIRPRSKANKMAEAGAVVTPVDLAAQDLILHALRGLLPATAVDAEEETETAALFPPEDPQGPVMIVDSIDGSLNYTRGLPNYAVTGALVQHGEFRAALVHFPANQDTYWARKGMGCFRQIFGREPVQAQIGNPPRIVLVSPTVPQPWRQALFAQGFTVEESQCSASDSLAPVISRAVGALAPGDVPRRRALGYLLAAEAGGAVRIGGGAWQGEADISEGEPYAIVAASEDMADQIESALRPVLRGKGAQPIRTLIVDDHRVVRQGIASLLRYEEDIEVAGQASNGLEAIEMADDLNPDIILMDVSMPEMNGIEATQRIHASHPEMVIIGLSMLDREEVRRRMLAAGAAGYLPKTGPAEDLLEAIRSRGRPRSI